MTATEQTQTPAHRPANGSIELIVLDQADDHFLVTFDRPGRIEIGLVATEQGVRVLAHAYDGSAIDTEQEPLFAYDGTGENQPVVC